MRLVFVHGWGFDASFWDALLPKLDPALGEFKVAEMGFFGGTPNYPECGGGDVLIGHSLGFLRGIAVAKKPRAWIAVNGFVRFAAEKGVKECCVSLTALKDMRRKLERDAPSVLAAFHASVGGDIPLGEPNVPALAEGLDILRDGDIKALLKTTTCPSLVLAGTHDPLVPLEASLAIGRAAAGTTATVFFEDGGHVLPLSHADRCAAEINRFLSRLSGGVGRP